MGYIKEYKDWLLENEKPNRPVKHITQLGINRKFSKDPFTGDKYETELFPKFRGLQTRFKVLKKMPNLDEFFIMMQNSDNTFYTMVQADELGQPDVRELWRDLTGQRASKMHKYNLAESRIDSDWKVKLTNDIIYENEFKELGNGFIDEKEMMIYINPDQLGSGEPIQESILMIESEAIAKYILSGSGYEHKYKELSKKMVEQIK